MTDRQTDEIGQEPPPNMMFDTMYAMNNLKSGGREPEEESQRRRRCDPEKGVEGRLASAKRNMHIRAPSGTLRLQGAEIKKAEDFKCLESTGHVEWEKKWEKRA